MSSQGPPPFKDVLLYHLNESRKFLLLMIFGMTCAEDPVNVTFSINTALRYGATEAEQKNDQLIADLKEKFFHWVIANSFRSQIDLLDHFLEQSLIYILAEGRETVIDEDGTFGKRFRNIRKINVYAKIDLLEKEHGVVVEGTSAVRSMNNFRRCVVHRQGRVWQDDCNDGDFLVLKWIGWTIKHHDGEDYVDYPADHRGPASEKPGDKGYLKFDWLEKRFPLHSSVKLSAVEACDLARAISVIIAKIGAEVAPIIKSHFGDEHGT